MHVDQCQPELPAAGVEFLMPEPDFEAIARLAAPYIGDDTIERITEQLRLVWNARGAADANVVALKLHQLIGTASGGVYAEHIIKALKDVDR